MSENNNLILKDLVRSLINIKEDDLNHLISVYQLFEVDVQESIDYCHAHICGIYTPKVNNLFRAIYVLSIQKHGLDVNDFEIECNYSMSKLTHLPSGEEITCSEDFKEIV